MFLKSAKCIAAALFVAANNLGLYALVVPLMAGVSGFFPALGITLLIWLFTLALGLLYLEATLTLPEGGNFLSLMEIHFGRAAKIITGIAILLFLCFFSLIVATQLVFPFVHEFLWQWVPTSLSDFSISLIFILLFGGLVFWGLFPSIVVNFFLMMALFFSLFLFVDSGKAHIDTANLTRVNWLYLPIGIYFLFSLSSIQIVIPSLSTFLKRDRKSLTFSLIFGTFLTYLFVFCLEWVIIGSFKEESFWRLLEGKNETIEGLAFLDSLPWTKEGTLFIGLFAFFTYALSYYCITVDIIFDGWKVPIEKRAGWRRLFVSFLLAFLVVLTANLITPSLFSLMDSLSDIVGLLTPILPLLVIWRLRYSLHYDQKPLLFGGKSMLFLLGVALFYLAGFQVVRFLS